ncbi:hypothetical protein ACISRB_33415, partial [Micromonospora aurantiaca]
MKNAAALSRTPVTGPVAGGSRARRGVRPGERETAPADLSTRDRVTQLLLERGPTTAAQLGSALGLSPAAIRRHNLHVNPKPHHNPHGDHQAPPHVAQHMNSKKQQT